MLMPAAVLVLLVLGALAVDSAVVFLAQRELVNAAAAAANDAAAEALDDAALYQRGSVAVDPARADLVAARSLAARAPAGVVLTGPPLVRVRAGQVCVSVEGRVDRLFGAALPGVGEAAPVRARAAASATDGSAVPVDEGLC
jgi:Flp pilus assembly protein TadG